MLMVNETEKMFFPPERFSGELIIGEHRVPVEFSASADCSGCLKFDIDPICAAGNMYKFISVQGKVGKSITLFGLHGKSQYGKTITSNDVYLTGHYISSNAGNSRPMADIRIGSYCTHLKMKASQPSDQPKLAFWLPNFECFKCLPAKTKIGLVGVYGSTKSKAKSNKLTGLLRIQAYDNNVTTNWKQEAERLLMRFTRILAFARGSYLSSPVTEFCENNHVETTFYGTDRAHSAEVFPPMSYLELGPIVLATAAQIDDITDQEWNALGKAINLMLEETNHLVSRFILEIAAQPCNNDASNLRCVQYVDNSDGDTITFNIAGVHPLLGKNINVRLAGIDTPEVRTKDKCEKVVGKIAKQIVATLLRKAKRIDLGNAQRGKYFRIVADVKVDGQSLTKMLLNRGVGYPYDGDKKRKINWCRGN